MRVLKELLGLTDPTMLFEANVPVELKDVIAAFPKHHGKALSKLWGDRRLVWHGKRFFDEDGLGAAYVEAEEAAEEHIKDGYNTEANIDFDGEIDGEEVDGTVMWEVEFEADEKQECYLGYDPTRDVLYIGFDAWTSDEGFNEAFDKAFEDAAGVSHDMDDEEHQAIYNKAWEEYKDGNFGFWGLVFEISFDGETMTAEEALPPMTGGFYKGMMRLFKQQHPKVIDLRLD